MSVNGVAAGNATDGAGGAQHMRGHHQLSDKAVSALADKLGMSADELKTKLSSSDDPRKVLDQLAEEKGISKQELRETIRSAMPKPAEGQGGPRPGGEGGPGKISFDDEAGKKLLATLADKMGTTADALKSKLDGGAHLGDILKESGLSHEDVKAAFEEAFKSMRGYGANGAADTSSQPPINAVDVQV